MGYEGALAEDQERCRLGIGRFRAAHDEAVPVAIRGSATHAPPASVLARDSGLLLDCLARPLDRFVLPCRDRIDDLAVPAGPYGMARVEARVGAKVERTGRSRS